MDCPVPESQKDRNSKTIQNIAGSPTPHPKLLNSENKFSLSQIEEAKEHSEIYYSQLVKPSKKFSNSYFVVFVCFLEEKEVRKKTFNTKKTEKEKRKESIVSQLHHERKDKE